MLVESIAFLPLIVNPNNRFSSIQIASVNISKMQPADAVELILVAEAISDDIHNRCMSAKDYSGCIQSNSEATAEKTKLDGGPGDQSDPEKCLSDGHCLAKAGLDELGLPKLVGWQYKYDPSTNKVFYVFEETYRVPHNGQPDRYVAIKRAEHFYQPPVDATPGYYREITPAKTTCTPIYTGGFKWVDGVLQRKTSGGQTCTTTSAQQRFVPGTPARPGGPRRKLMVEVIDCKDKTVALYLSNGTILGKWKKYTGHNITFFCKNRASHKVLNMSL